MNTDSNMNNEPSESGTIEFVLPITPVSIQASGSRRALVQQNIKRLTTPIRYTMTGDVSVEIEWFIHEQARYESDSPADVDNIIKPMLDALCGCDGILVDDCQVQSIVCSWIDWNSTGQQIRIRIRYSPDEWINKDGLAFVHLGRGLCMPIDMNDEDELITRILDILETTIKLRDEMLASTGDYYMAQRVMPIQRVFHRSKVNRFTVLEISELRERTRNQEMVLVDH